MYSSWQNRHPSLIPILTSKPLKLFLCRISTRIMCVATDCTTYEPGWTASMQTYQRLWVQCGVRRGTAGWWWLFSLDKKSQYPTTLSSLNRCFLSLTVMLHCYFSSFSFQFQCISLHRPLYLTTFHYQTASHFLHNLPFRQRESLADISGGNPSVIVVASIWILKTEQTSTPPPALTHISQVPKLIDTIQGYTPINKPSQPY